MHSDSDSEPDPEPEVELQMNSDFTGNEWPRLILIEFLSADRPIVKLSPFAIEIGIKGIAGTVAPVMKLHSGQIN